MRLKIIALSAVALTMMGGAVLAAGGNTTALDQAKMEPFYTDSSMTVSYTHLTLPTSDLV